MALSGSMFLFEILIKDLRSQKNCEDYRVVGQFENIFQFNINNPKKDIARKTRAKQKTKIRISRSATKKPPAKIKLHTGQSILIINQTNSLISTMKEYPLELFICRESEPDLKIASTRIPWSNLFLNYLSNELKKPDSLPPVVEGLYNLYDEITSKRIAVIELSVKLTYLSDKVTSRFRSLSEDKNSTFLYTQINSKPISLLSNVREQIKHNQSRYLQSKESDLAMAKCLEQHRRYEISKLKDSHVNEVYKNDEIPLILETSKLKANGNENKTCNLSVKVIKSEPQIICNKPKILQKSKSYSSIYCKKEKNVFQYIFGNPQKRFNRKVYHVGYFTVENDDSDPDSVRVSSEPRSSSQSPRSDSIKRKFRFKKCDSKCRTNADTPGMCSESVCSTDLPAEAAHLITVTKCKAIDCEHKKYRELPSPPDERILLDLENAKTPCCAGIEVKEKIEEVVGGVSAKLKIGEDPCFCTCECTFGFTKKTTYCDVCGGYETVGEDLSRKPAHETPIPCPIFHKLIDKNKLKTYSTSGSESKKKGDDQRSMKAGSAQRAASEKRQATEKKDVESEKDSKKKKKKDDRFKFNYGYKAPQIGHSRCALPCTGTLANVPRKMGWLWTAEDIPGMKFRPMWKPGATNKHVVRLLKIARNPGEVISKKKRKDSGKKKRPLKRPLLVVHKKDGEYTVTMETMKSYFRPRALNQQPYEDKPVVTYTIGRTEEENRERLKKKEREQRRLERAQRDFIQSAFRDMCHEICLKTYQQALGILPDTEDPPCTCYPALPTPKTTNMDVSCSCSEDSGSIGSDTDSDEWIVEFTPPNATFDPTYKGKKIVKSDNSSQYTYLDYRVKLLDRYGNPVPRFFKGPDGKQQCSDLGGFWSPDHKWLEINIDGYVAPDGRWAPNSFIGPNGEQVDAESGKFQAMNGKWLVVGVDGYIDFQGKWKNYPKPHEAPKARRKIVDTKKGKPGEIKHDYKSEASWSCFGDASPRQLSKLGIVGHGGDRKLLITTLEDMLAHGENVQIPQPATVFHLPSTKKSKGHQLRHNMRHLRGIDERTKCHHPTPSDKGIVAVDSHGNKTYFRLTDRKNKRPKDRLTTLARQGISLSSFHVPCFNSFINSEVMRKQQRERLIALTSKNISTQIS